MALKSLVISGLAAIAMAQDTKFRCGQEQPSKALLEISDKFRARENKLTSNRLTAMQGIEVETYIHFIAKDETPEGGHIDRAVAEKQMEVLNAGYSDAGVTFKLADVDWTVNEAWHSGQDDVAMKAKLRKGTYKTLNLYYTANPDGNPQVLGYCHFPEAVTEGSAEFLRDGCIMSSITLPGGSRQENNEGKVTIHEVGHWFGLFHTFQDGCTEKGDLVDDTPAVAAPAWDCPTEAVDSCPDLPGNDIITNFMDYRPDSCWKDFTVGQINRLKSSWNEFRANN